MSYIEDSIISAYEKGISVESIVKSVSDIMNDRYEGTVKNTIRDARKLTEQTIVDYCRGGIDE